MLDTYFPLLVLMILVAGFLVTMLGLAAILGPKRHSPVKDDPFECGTIATGDVSGRHTVKFYLIAMTFIVFDVEVVFLYPWAMSLREIGAPALYAALPFIFILALGLAYEWKKGVLDV
ncbi:MAG TPA: NADH-quinone oxidoreductase subunit A [Oligoflexia bacterium]|nr:NADH-quinone oxidoreductase subunit A [Oligoflexia bacterium]HMP49225.1 NADH-quinone oxidoreductase subunit A [Oligoflexia bacterium]